MAAKQGYRLIVSNLFDSGLNDSLLSARSEHNVQIHNVSVSASVGKQMSSTLGLVVDVRFYSPSRLKTPHTSNALFAYAVRFLNPRLVPILRYLPPGRHADCTLIVNTVDTPSPPRAAIFIPHKHRVSFSLMLRDLCIRKFRPTRALHVLHFQI